MTHILIKEILIKEILINFFKFLFINLTFYIFYKKNMTLILCHTPLENFIINLN